MSYLQLCVLSSFYTNISAIYSRIPTHRNSKGFRGRGSTCPQCPSAAMALMIVNRIDALIQ